MKKLLLDTNFLTVPFQFKVDIFQELERIFSENYSIFTLDRCIKEGKKIENGKYKELIRKLIEEKPIEVIKTSSKLKTDELILQYSKKDFIVCTNDKELKNKILEEKNPVVVLRGKTRLELKRG